MYRAHSKDINRNKSFHPLTYKNLRRVEILQEGEEEKKQRAADRQKELQHDQEERRYDELVLANSADSLSGELARFRQTKNIFKAEYEAESAKQQQQVKEEKASSSSLSGAAGTFAASSNAFLSKFKKEGSTQHAATLSLLNASAKTEVKAETDDDPRVASASLSTADASGKRARDDADGTDGGAHHKIAKSDTNTNNSSSGATTTGFVTSAEAAQLRKELNLAQKQRHDPLMRVKQYQNSCVANAARQQELQQREHDDAADQQHGSADRLKKDNNDALQNRIRELLALKKKK